MNLTCAKMFPNFGCKSICVITVEALKDGCHNCCRNGKFYEDCCEPIKNVVQYMGEGCEPI